MSPSQGRTRSERRPPFGAPAVPLRDPEALSGVESLTRGPEQGLGVPRAGALGRGVPPRPRGAGAPPAALQSVAGTCDKIHPFRPCNGHFPAS